MEERDQRWKRFLQISFSDEGKRDALFSSLFQEIIIENYISIEITDSHDFTQLYRQVEQSIPEDWFIARNDEINFYEQFSSCAILEIISDRAKRKIWADTPRTFDIFSRKSAEIEQILSSEETSSLYRAILCRILCTSSILLGGWYCQGMAFVAGSCMFYFKEFSAGNLDKVSQQRLGVYSCGLYHYCFIKENHIEALYRNSALLSAYMNELAYQLSMNPNTAPTYSHMSSIGFTVHFFALEWFTACFLLNVSHESSLLIHDLLIYGQANTKNDLLIKIGMSIISSLSSKLLEYTSFETIHMEFKSLVMSLSPHEIVMDALEYQLIPHKIENLPSFTSVLQLLNESPEHILAIHSLTPSEENNVVSQPKKDRRGCVVM